MLLYTRSEVRGGGGKPKLWTVTGAVLTQVITKRSKVSLEKAQDLWRKAAYAAIALREEPPTGVDIKHYPPVLAPPPRPADSGPTKEGR